MSTHLVKSGQKGQILLVVVLAAVISLTVGLSAIGRTISNTKVSIQEESSQRALSAAEAGAEKLLNSSGLLVSEGALSNSSNFNATVEEVPANDVELNGGNFVKKDEGADIWLSKTDFSGQWGGGSPKTLSIYWADNDTSSGCTTAVPAKVNAAIQVSVLSGADKNNPTMTTYAYDACVSRRSANGFASPDPGITYNKKTYNHSFQVTVSNGFIARIIPVYADAYILVNGTRLPSQGRIIKSTGTAGNTTRKIRVFQGNPKIPTEFFPYNLFLP